MKCPNCNETMKQISTETKKKVRTQSEDGLVRYCIKKVHNFLCQNCGLKLNPYAVLEPYLKANDHYNEIDRICRMIKAKLRKRYPQHDILNIVKGKPRLLRYYKPKQMRESDQVFEDQIDEAIYEVVKNDWNLICAMIAPLFIDYMLNKGMRKKDRKFDGKQYSKGLSVFVDKETFTKVIESQKKNIKQKPPPKPPELGG